MITELSFSWCRMTPLIVEQLCKALESNKVDF